MLRANQWKWLPLLLVAWLWVLSIQFDLKQLLLGYGSFFGLGVLGAIFANSTGAGGGVVFIPAFNSLSFDEMQSVHTSFAIQCFGMSAGAIAWWRYRSRSLELLPDWSLLPRLIGIAAPTSVLGLSVVWFFALAAPASVHSIFSVFSILLALALLLSLTVKPNGHPSHLHTADFVVVALISALGGVITAWLSVGVGEFIAVYLILRRVDVRVAVACAVIVTAISVWFSAISLLLLDRFTVFWQVALMAGPGALVGGVLARRLATWISPLLLKRVFAVWILLVGVVGLSESF